MNINRLIQMISGAKLAGNASVTLRTADAEFYVEMIDESEYDRLVSSEGIHSVSAELVHSGIAHGVRFKVRSDDFEFQLSF